MIEYQLVCVYLKASISEVFKLWVTTQTWVAMALSLGRGPFCDPKSLQKWKEKNTLQKNKHTNNTQTNLMYHYKHDKQNKNHFALRRGSKWQK